MQRGDKGINALDEACKQHDISYSKHFDLQNRHQADKILEEQARQRLLASDSSLGEKAAAFVVSNTMKAKQKLGLGLKKPSISKSKKKSFRKAVLDHLKNEMKHLESRNVESSADLKLAASKAIGVAKKLVKNAGGRKKIRVPRVIPIPKRGGVLPFLLPLFAGISAAGGLGTGIASIVRAVKATKEAQDNLNETKRHNRSIEEIALHQNKQGSGMFLKPYKHGLGLFLNQPAKNFH